MEKIFTRLVKCVCFQVNSSFPVINSGKNFCTLGLRIGTPNFLPLSVGNYEIKEKYRFSLHEFHTHHVNYARRDKKHRGNILRFVEKKDDGIDEDQNVMVDFRGFGTVFPDETTPDKLYDNEKFAHLPIVSVKVTRNNTILQLADYKGNSKIIRSCGVEGFKNTKKGTNVAAQVTAETFAQMAYHRGFRNVRVAIRGLGPGRLASLKGLVDGGLNVVCIADVTPISFYFSPRPRKAKKGSRIYI